MIILYLFFRAYDRQHRYKTLFRPNRLCVQIHAVSSHTRGHKTNPRLQRTAWSGKLWKDYQLLLSLDAKCRCCNCRNRRATQWAVRGTKPVGRGFWIFRMAQVIGGPSFELWKLKERLLSVFFKASHFIKADFKLIAYTEKPKQSKIQTNKHCCQENKDWKAYKLFVSLRGLKAENWEPWDWSMVKTSTSSSTECCLGTSQKLQINNFVCHAPICSQKRYWEVYKTTQNKIGKRMPESET